MKLVKYVFSSNWYLNIAVDDIAMNKKEISMKASNEI